MASRRELANAIRFLSMDAVQKAKSGHPGAPMGMADIAEVLWRDFLVHNPTNPSWANRDRFVLSNGHGSMLIYSLLHLTGYDLSIDDLKQFRQLHSKTPGHPEYGYAPGVETTTGPLGQGITNAVGMAIAEKTLAGQFNRDGHNIVDHHTYAFLGDGCLMEGISHEACSLAGTLGLGKLIAFYDDNNISIDGHVDGWFTDDTQKRFEAYGWQVIPAVDGHDAAQVKSAVEQAKAETAKPTLIICKTITGYGSPNKSNSHDSHGAPLGDEEIALTRKALNWAQAAFDIPKEIYAEWDAKSKGQAAEKAWDEKFAAYQAAYPELAAEFKRRTHGDLPANWQAESQKFIEKLQANPAAIASRKASQNAIEAYAPLLPEFLGGSADLASSNLTLWSGSKPIRANIVDGNYIKVRENSDGSIEGIQMIGNAESYNITNNIFELHGIMNHAIVSLHGRSDGEQPLLYVIDNELITDRSVIYRGWIEHVKADIYADDNNHNGDAINAIKSVENPMIGQPVLTSAKLSLDIGTDTLVSSKTAEVKLLAASSDDADAADKTVLDSASDEHADKLVPGDTLVLSDLLSTTTLDLSGALGEHGSSGLGTVAFTAPAEYGASLITVDDSIQHDANTAAIL